MSHVDTLKIYEGYRAAGLSEKQAQEYTMIIENTFIKTVSELKEEFASKNSICIFAILSSLIFFIVVCYAFLLWRTTLDLEVLKVVQKTHSEQLQMR